MAKITFPKDFIWGSATASYQIEGAAKEDGRGESIWDRFCSMPGNIVNGDSGEVICDHYHRFKEDVALIKALGHKAYRFSVAWPRILPNGTGAVNPKGIRFYSDLIDELLKNGIEPMLTIYHWDLPQALQDRGGWANEESISWFREYCRVLFNAFSGRVKYWITLNEPFCTSWLGNFTGAHAPGYHDLATALRVSYNLLRAHGAGVRLFREMQVPGEIGIVFNHTPTEPASDNPLDAMAARNQDGWNNRWYFDPVFLGKFPRDMIELYKTAGITLPDFSDETSIAEKLDFVGLNYYFPAKVRYDENAWLFKAADVSTGLPVTDFGWPISGEAFCDLIIHLDRHYHIPKLFITENGAAYDDVRQEDGSVKDELRIDYFKKHLKGLREAMDAGVDVRGYFAWSLMDNFEWAFGKSKRFGIVYVDFETEKRLPKASAYWFKKLIEENGFEA